MKYLLLVLAIIGLKMFIERDDIAESMSKIKASNLAKRTETVDIGGLRVGEHFSTHRFRFETPNTLMIASRGRVTRLSYSETVDLRNHLNRVLSQ